jgi:cytochrome c oxidase subunit 4
MASDSLKLYTAIYVALLALASSKYLFFHTLPFGYWQALVATMIAASLKTGLIVGYFQHLRSENRSLTWLMALSFGLVMLLMAAASFSIT